MRYGWRIVAAVAGLVAVGACGDSADPGTGPVIEPLEVVQAAGDLTASITQFRALIGDPANGGTAGQQPGGRREIKWDGVPADRTDTDDFPADFFNTVVKAGLIYATDGTGFRVSDNDFADVNPTYGAQFESFSKVKTFMAVGSRRMTLTFRVAGDATAATTKGIGIVFSDVDRVGSAGIELFTESGESLGQYTAPVRTDAAGHSFIGVVFAQPVIARVVVKAGDAALGAGVNDVSDGGASDLVVTDDFLYAEPGA
jgi:hypothetical protein